jgi:hypothetical protein
VVRRGRHRHEWSVVTVVVAGPRSPPRPALRIRPAERGEDATDC